MPSTTKCVEDGSARFSCICSAATNRPVLPNSSTTCLAALPSSAVEPGSAWPEPGVAGPERAVATPRGISGAATSAALRAIDALLRRRRLRRPISVRRRRWRERFRERSQISIDARSRSCDGLKAASERASDKPCSFRLFASGVSCRARVNRSRYAARAAIRPRGRSRLGSPGLRPNDGTEIRRYLCQRAG